MIDTMFLFMGFILIAHFVLIFLVFCMAVFVWITVKTVRFVNKKLESENKTNASFYKDIL